MTGFFTPDADGRCTDCGGRGAHYCGRVPTHHRAGYKPVCRYCWAPVNPIVKRGLLRGWERFCSPVCKKLAARPADTRPGKATMALLVQVAGTEPEAVAA